jgi:hypothetical protein
MVRRRMLKIIRSKETSQIAPKGALVSFSGVGKAAWNCGLQLSSCLVSRSRMVDIYLRSPSVLTAWSLFN